MQAVIECYLRRLTERRECFSQLVRLDIGAEVADEDVIVTYNRRHSTFTAHFRHDYPDYLTLPVFTVTVTIIKHSQRAYYKRVVRT